MIMGILFWLLASVCCAYAAIFGGRDGRWAVAMILLTSIVTVPATLLGASWGKTELAIFVIDAALLVGLYGLMLASRRYWPIWMTGFHLVAVVSHASTLLAPHYAPHIYRALASFWAIPVLLSLLIGVVLDQRAATAAVDRAAPDDRSSADEPIRD